ncbi:hypothetical protein ABZU86_13410 [Streptomyces sp. NPDC005271]|uniref:hypothetical protein n=1 Tax=unclassified Streptomyces TaxID=2593676 RepID=UPI0033A788ED
MIDQLLTVIVTSVLAWVLGTQITYRWDEVKRRRDLDLAAVSEFYRCYGAFLQTWRLWNTHHRNLGPGVAPDDVQWQCLERAAVVEGDFEGILVKVVSERRLTDRDIQLLGSFREAYQCLRERIREGEELRWFSRCQPEMLEFRQYRAFKSLSMYVAALLQERGTSWLVGHRRRDAPSEPERITALLGVTVGTRRGDWVEVAERELRLALH